MCKFPFYFYVTLFIIRVYKCIICCVECCLRCITKFLEFINKHAYIMISIKGDSFCTAAWEGGVVRSWVDSDGTRRRQKGGEIK